MKRWLPAPLVSAGLFALWMLLSRSPTLGHMLLGVVVAVLAPLLTAPLRPAAGPLRHPILIARLVLRVAGDVVVSALGVGRGVLTSRTRPPRAAFVVVPLALRDPHALAALAIITTVVPGTVWAELAPDRSALRLHVFEVGDEQAFVDYYKKRYEQPLREIFE